MRRRRQRREAPVLLASCVLSAGLHLLIAEPLRHLIEGFLAAPGNPEPVRVVQLSQTQWDQNFQVRAPRNPLLDTSPQDAEQAERARAEEAKRKAEEEKKKQKEEKLTGQIVEVPPTEDDSPNPDAKYLSKYNSHVKKETTARADARNSKLRRVTNKLQTKERKTQNPESGLKTPGLSVQGDGLQEDVEGTPKEKRFVLKVPDILRRDAVSLSPMDLGAGPGVSNRSASEAMRGNADELDIQLGSGASDAEGEAGGKKGAKHAGKKSLPTLSALVPNFGTLARISGSPSRDYVEGVPEGEGTFLNAKEFKYATFFYRVRDSVADYWEDLAAREYRRRDPTGNIYGIRDRSTLLRIELNKQGQLDDIRVEQTSGVDFLDNVAVEAFRKAQPFPNPPSGISDTDGMIRFNFQFIITMNANRGLNIFRNYR